MKMILIVVLVALAGVVAGAENIFVNIITQQERGTLPVGAVEINGLVYPSAGIVQWATRGWRMAESPVAPAGYVLVSHTWEQDAGDPERAVAILVTRTVADQAALDAAAASNAAYFASLPVQMPTGAEMPTLVLMAQTNGTPGVALEADESGDLYTYVYHASPVDPAAVASNRAAAGVARRELRLDLRDIKAAMTNSIANMQAVAAWTNGVTAAQQRGSFNDVRRELITTQQELNNLRRIVAQTMKGD